MLTNSDRTVLYGLGIFIAYQVYKCCNPGSGAGSSVPLSGQVGQLTTPGWIQQLSEYEWDTDYFTPSGGFFGRCS